MTPGARVRVVIVDDEPLARETLRLLMRSDAGVDIVGECASGSEAVETIARVAPDLVFLDIQMPELDGFQTLARLGGLGAARPIIVFVTAYDRYALKAFDAHALDYLVKPFTDERFHETLARAKDHVRQRAFGALGERVLSLLRAQGLAVPDAPAGLPASHAAPDRGDGQAATLPPTPTTTAVVMTTSVAMTMPVSDGVTTAVGATTDVGTPAPRAADARTRPLDRIPIKSRGRVTFVRTADIDWIEACDDHIRLHAGSVTHELRQPLKELAARLDARRFVRIHRSAIVNLDRVQELQPHFHGSYLVVLKNGASLPLSRARRDELRTALGGLLP